MSNLLSLSREEFEQKWPYEVFRWRKKRMDWEASKTMKSDVWDGDLLQKNSWICRPTGTGMMDAFTGSPKLLLQAHKQAVRRI